MATMRTQHAGPVRMPFGEISGDRLQNLDSTKNRQNALQFAPTTKRKATESINESFNIFCDSEDTQDSENIDPTAFYKNKTNKRSKTSIFRKITQFETIVKPTLSTSLPQLSTTSTILPTTTQHRKTAKPRSRLQKSKPTTIFNDSTSTTDKMLQARLHHPAGRSPTTGRPRVSSMLSGRERPAAPAFGVARVRDSNRFGLVKSASLNSALGSGGGSALPFDISAAIQGTLPSGHPLNQISAALSLAYGVERHGVKANLPKSTSAPGNLLSPRVPKKSPAAWDFTIHEDTEDQERENIVSHNIEQLGVSDDEDSINNHDSFASDKENVPPPDWEPATIPRRNQAHAIASALGIEPNASNGMTMYYDETSETNENYENSENLLATPHKHALRPTGEPAEVWDRPVPGDLPRSPGMINLAQLSSPAPKKRHALDELPLEEFVPADAEEEEAKAEEQGEKREGWLTGDGRLSPIDEDASVEEDVVGEEDFENSLEVLERCDEEMGFREEVQVIIHPPRISSLPGASAI